MRRNLLTALILLVLTVLLTATSSTVRLLWPPLVALAVIVLTRHALVGLLAGALSGALILAGAHPWTVPVDLVARDLWPGLQSPWKLGAIAFTFLLGGFAGVLERGGGFTRLLTGGSGNGGDPARRLEASAAGLGILCFFDGLANSMIVGRVGRDLADRAGTARVKLAYIADSTSSAVACVAVISTWIAFQLTMIEEAYALAGLTVNPYAVFLQSLPYNFYCWFTLVMLFVAIRGRFHPGPMATFAAEATPTRMAAGGETRESGSLASVLVPLAVLLIAFFAGFLLLGTDGQPWPLTRDRIVAAFGSSQGPLVMVLASVAASVTALLMFPRHLGAGDGLRAFVQGVRTMFVPILVLLAAWMLGSVMGALGTADLIAGLATRTGSAALVPTVVFLTGAILSFVTGTSWGTMGLLFPLAVPAAASLGAPAESLALVVAAVFSGAVFGDHCSPFSDTTIVTSISCGVEPHDHVRTQLPYALLTAGVAVVLGFLPAGLGLSPYWILPTGALALLVLPRLWKALPFK